MSDEMQFIMDFYQKSWDNLILVISVAGFLLTIIWPMTIFIFSHKEYKYYKKKLERDIEKKKDEIDEKMNIHESRIEEIDRKEKILDGKMILAQAQSTSDPSWKIYGLLNAYVSFIEARDTVSMNMIYIYLSPYLQNNQAKITKDTFDTGQLIMVKMAVEKIIDGLKQLNDDAYCKYYIDIFEDFRNRLGKISA